MLAANDHMIGDTKIDLEERFYSPKWRDYKLKPIEYRTLWNASSSSPQGKLKLWIDILTLEQAKVSPIIDISPPLPLQYELRVIVWDVKNIDMRGKVCRIFLLPFHDYLFFLSRM